MLKLAFKVDLNNVIFILAPILASKSSKASLSLMILWQFEMLQSEDQFTLGYFKGHPCPGVKIHNKKTYKKLGNLFFDTHSSCSKLHCCHSMLSYFLSWLESTSHHTLHFFKSRFFNTFIYILYQNVYISLL